MPLSDTDLMMVQQSGTAYKVSTKTLKTYFQTGSTTAAATATTLGTIKVGTNLAIDANGVLSANVTGALTYKGTADLTAAPTAAITTGLAVGHLYVNNTGGTIDAGWTGLTGSAAVGEMIIWDGAKWDIIGVGASSSVTSVTGTAPVVVGGTATAPAISVSNAVASAAGAGGSAGLLTAVDKEKLDGIASGAQTGTVTSISGTAPVQVATPTTTPVISVDDASTTAKGITQFATSAETAYNVAAPVQTKAVTPFAVQANYMPKDISLLTDLP